jgi:hypothetical protein
VPRLQIISLKPSLRVGSDSSVELLPATILDFEIFAIPAVGPLMREMQESKESEWPLRAQRQRMICPLGAADPAAAVGAARLRMVVDESF